MWSKAGGVGAIAATDVAAVTVATLVAEVGGDRVSPSVDGVWRVVPVAVQLGEGVACMCCNVDSDYAWVSTLLL
jgi:hypothetical protein